MAGPVTPKHRGGGSGRWTGRLRSWPTALLAFVVLLAIGVLVVVHQHRALNTERHTRSVSEQGLRARLVTAQEELKSLQGQSAALAERVHALSKNLARTKQGYAPLAKRVLQSVFTVEGQFSQGTAWAAWQADGYTYLITADHVVADDVGAGATTMTVKQANRSWTGTIGATDRTNDLAVVRVHALVGKPLWQDPGLDISPLPGDQLLLVGSPYGLEGTVTTGVISRVTYDAIQTDAAANPGNSGGPAVDSQGRVVGILVSGGGENINFAVPIQRACVRIRHC
jgi:S1-C subfamily serine protease